MKKILILILSATLLLAVGCGEAEVKESRLIDGSIEYTAETLPKICVTELTKKQGVSIASAVLGVDAETAEQYISVCDTTDDCYLNLADGKCDIVIAHSYGKTATEKLAESNIALTKAELQKDALVFVANERAGVKDLTVEQLTSLFKGEITNWSALGGPDLAVTLFGQKDKSATENAFDKYISAEIAVPAVMKTVITENGEYVAEIGYDNRDGAVGYTLLSLVGSYNGGAVKPISVGGAVPTKEAVQSGQYSLTSEVNVAIRSFEAEGSGVKILYNWIVSEQGRAVAGKLY